MVRRGSIIQSSRSVTPHSTQYTDCDDDVCVTSEASHTKYNVLPSAQSTGNCVLDVWRGSTLESTQNRSRSTVAGATSAWPRSWAPDTFTPHLSEPSEISSQPRIPVGVLGAVEHATLGDSKEVLRVGADDVEHGNL